MQLWILSKVIIVTMTGFLMNGEILESESEINHPPELREEMPDPETIVPWAEYEIDVRDVFSDVDGDELVFSALSQSQSVAKVEVEGSIIKVMAQKTGKVTIIVTASDQRGGTASTAYRFIVN
ncbi:Ig-like domain-containing protein [Brevibacillus choshinensis]|uniref:Ig-like domain-containing protein n=1 Tax=Brevibacillus choshinensis TaxID=54911 RepID=UPI002E205B68|nr:hypothetical protein [Brevibacillus choshinensis]MED4750392.1 hypothetical protein [Brevibacillus choshinensis]